MLSSTLTSSALVAPALHISCLLFDEAELREGGAMLAMVEVFGFGFGFDECCEAA